MKTLRIPRAASFFILGVIHRFTWLLIAAIGFVLASALAQDSPPGPTVIINPNRPNPKIAPPTAATTSETGRTLLLPSSPNVLIVDAIESMPSRGGYRANESAVSALRGSIRMVDSRLSLAPAQATPSFCSGATYLVFVSVLNELQEVGHIGMDGATLRALLVQEHQADGSGIWGRWNANGPGTARLFFETGLGRNFTSFDEARPGDFMKVWWNDQIGALEHGHSVIFLGLVNRTDGQYVHYWSSNVPDGFGQAYVSRQKIARALFSRLEHPEQIGRIMQLPAKDPYLASLLKKSSSVEEMARMVGLPEVEAVPLIPAPPTPPASAVRPLAANKPSSATGSIAAASPSPSPASPTPKGSWLSNLFRRQQSSER